ncbi:DUF1488 family protein [Caballeronia grimmiae]|uniref:DUF1488 family protein n=1 Tax=Caballeronia grimmiae TaxID=1071679 RepID=UPI0038B9E684
MTLTESPLNASDLLSIVLANRNPFMKVFVPEPQISADKQTLSFVIDWRGQSVTCVVPRRCLEAFFWLPPDADDARVVRVLRDGFSRIEAVARRKLMGRSTRPVRLTEADFSRA